MELANPLLQYGVAGIALIAQSYVVSRLYNDNKALQAKIEAVQDAHREDVVSYGTKAIEAMQSFSQTTQLIESKILLSKGKR